MTDTSAVKTSTQELEKVEEKKAPSIEAMAAFKEIQATLITSVVEQHNALIADKNNLLDSEILVVMSQETIDWYHKMYAIMAPPDVSLTPKFIIGHKICVNDGVPFQKTLVVYPLK